MTSMKMAVYWDIVLAEDSHLQLNYDYWNIRHDCDHAVVTLISFKVYSISFQTFAEDIKFLLSILKQILLCLVTL
jgi:hypothetical protein